MIKAKGEIRRLFLICIYHVTNRILVKVGRGAIFAVGFVLYAQFFAPFSTHAAGLRISPLTFEITANPGDTISNVLEVYNTEEEAVTVIMEAQDFVPLGEGGQVMIAEESNETFSLAKWMVLSPTEFFMEPGERRVVTFTIQVPHNGEPGGHYGSVLTKIAGSPSGGASAVAQKIGSLLLLQVAGPVQEQMWVKSFAVPEFSEQGPITFETRLENVGSVHLKPYGFVTITDIFGRKQAQLSIDAKNVLPNSIRKIDTVWNEKFLFGRYTATITAVYGSANAPLSYVTTFWVIPWKQTAAGGFGALILLFILFKMRRRFATALKIMLIGEKKPPKNRPPKTPSSSIRANLTGYEE